MDTRSDRTLVWRTRILARVVAAALLLVVGLFLVGEGLPPIDLKTDVGLQSVFFGTLCLGLALGFRWELAGGLTALAGFLGFCAVEMADGGGMPGGYVFSSMGGAGLLFVLVWAFDRPGNAGERESAE